MIPYGVRNLKRNYKVKLNIKNNFFNIFPQVSTLSLNPNSLGLVKDSTFFKHERMGGVDE